MLFGTGLANFCMYMSRVSSPHQAHRQVSAACNKLILAAPLEQPRKKLLERTPWPKMMQLEYNSWFSCVFSDSEVGTLTLGRATFRRCCNGVAGLAKYGDLGTRSKSRISQLPQVHEMVHHFVATSKFYPRSAGDSTLVKNCALDG